MEHFENCLNLPSPKFHVQMPVCTWNSTNFAYKSWPRINLHPISFCKQVIYCTFRVGHIFSLSTIPCNYRMSVSNLFNCTSVSDLCHCMPMSKTLELDRVPAWWRLYVPKNTDCPTHVGYDLYWPWSLVITIPLHPIVSITTHISEMLKSALVVLALFNY